MSARPHELSKATQVTPIRTAPAGQPVASPPTTEHDEVQRWARIPQALRDRRQWCVAGQSEKRPLQVDGRPASPTHPTTWTDFETASRAAQAKGWHVGYVLTADDPFTCIDLDVKGDVKPEDFDSHIQMLDSYTERSVSGKGFHVWVEGRVEKAAKSPTIEIYSQDRFIICTGVVVRNKPIMNRDAMVKDLAGQWHDRRGSHSELDYALAKDLVRAFQMTPAGQRDKAQRRPDYVSGTLTQAQAEVEADAAATEHGRKIWEAIKPGLMARYHIPVLTDEDLFRLPPLRWLIKDICPEVGLVTIYGQEKTGKSFLSMDMLAAISSGPGMWFGKKVKPVPCVYVPFEGRGGIPDRARAWQQVHKKPTNIHFIMHPINLRRETDRNWLVETLIAKGLAGGVLEIDTLAASAGSFDENSSKDMGEMIAIFQDLQNRLGGVVLVVHHSGKDASRGLRGHSSLGGAIDCAIETMKDDQGSLFRIALMKDGEQGAQFPFAMEKHWVRNDEDGEPVFSMVVRPQERVPASDVEAEMVLSAMRPLGRTSQRKIIEKLDGHLAQRRATAAIAKLMDDGRIKSNGKKGKYAEVWAV
jgi:hypothetical protein